MKLCKDCSYVTNRLPAFAEGTGNPYTFWQCGKKGLISPVTGIHIFEYCDGERAQTGDKHCGPEGKFFDAADKKDRGSFADYEEESNDD